MIYFVQSVDGGPIKIGTSESPVVRKQKLESDHQTKMVFLRVITGGFAEERELHTKFEHLRIEGTEWFQPDDDLLDHIRYLAFADIPMSSLPAPLPSVKVHDDVLELARIIASYRGTETITEIISNNIRPILLKLQEEEAAKFAKRTGGK